ncbi:MAG: hypothetical protein PF572_03380 [Patescibacteria group bacterium]|jgi:hypothetical protein|nr:hypothetical protein [Patescibacteria group bacterium]
MMPKFSCSICGKEYSGSGNFEPCPLYFQHKDILNRKKEVKKKEKKIDNKLDGDNLDVSVNIWVDQETGEVIVIK